MKRNKHLGECAICGKTRTLTFEHIPPKSAFNNQPVKQYNVFNSFGTSNKPWDFDGLKYINAQKGKGFYSLCRECNNNTGAWYGKDYCEFVQKIGNETLNLNYEINDNIVFKINEIYPLRIIKQIISMFLSLNKGCDFQDLKDFIMDKNSNNFNKDKYKICIYFYKGTVVKQLPICAVGNLKKGSFKLISEIADFPIGIILYIDLEPNQKTDGIDITDFCFCDYNQKYNVTIPLLFKEVNSPIPCDFRTKAEIIKTIEENKEYLLEKV